MKKSLVLVMAMVLLMGMIAEARSYLNFGRDPKKPGGIHECDLREGQSLAPLEYDAYIIMDSGSGRLSEGYAPAGTLCQWEEKVYNGKRYKRLKAIQVCGNEVQNDILIPLLEQPKPQVQSQPLNVTVNVNVSQPSAPPVYQICQPGQPFTASSTSYGGMYFSNVPTYGGTTINVKGATAYGGNATGGNAVATGGHATGGNAGVFNSGNSTSISGSHSTSSSASSASAAAAAASH